MHIGVGRRVRTSHLFSLAPTLFHVPSVKEIKVFLTFTRSKFVLFSPGVHFRFLGPKISHEFTLNPLQIKYSKCSVFNLYSKLTHDGQQRNNYLFECIFFLSFLLPSNFSQLYPSCMTLILPKRLLCRRSGEFPSKPLFFLHS